jgi:hypothetical protein
MNTAEWPPQIGVWYLRLDRGTGETFQVTAYDETGCKASTVSYDGVSDEMDQATWGRLSPSLADPPEDWMEPLEMVDVVRFGTAQNSPVSEDLSDPATPTE